MNDLVTRLRPVSFASMTGLRALHEHAEVHVKHLGREVE